MSLIYDSFVVEFEPYPYTHDDFEDFLETLGEELANPDAPFEVGLSAVGTRVSIDFTPPHDDEKNEVIRWAVLCIERAGGRGTVTYKTETTIIDSTIDSSVSDERYLDTTAD